MTDVMTVTVNPSVDLFSEAELVRPIRKIRTSGDRADPGGGGINVARVITVLGGAAEAVFLAGGPTGQWLKRLVEKEGIRSHVLPIDGDTRVSFSVSEQSSGYDYRFVRAGPDIAQKEMEPVVDIVARHAGRYVVASGSLPASAGPDFYARLARAANANGARFVLDTSGPSLRATLDEGGVYLVKPSQGELEELVGGELDDHGIREAAQWLVRRGAARMVAVSMGAQGALLASEEGVVCRRAPRVRIRSAIGAGDSFVGAMVWALSQGWEREKAFVLAIAAGAAAVLTPGTQLCRKEDVERLFAELQND